MLRKRKFSVPSGRSKSLKRDKLGDTIQMGRHRGRNLARNFPEGGKSGQSMGERQQGSKKKQALRVPETRGARRGKKTDGKHPVRKFLPKRGI